MKYIIAMVMLVFNLDMFYKMCLNQVKLNKANKVKGDRQ